jgi:hypothetical protein
MTVRNACCSRMAYGVAAWRCSRMALQPHGAAAAWRCSRMALQPHGAAAAWRCPFQALAGKHKRAARNKFVSRNCDMHVAAAAALPSGRVGAGRRQRTTCACFAGGGVHAAAARRCRWGGRTSSTQVTRDGSHEQQQQQHAACTRRCTCSCRTALFQPSRGEGRRGARAASGAC